MKNIAKRSTRIVELVSLSSSAEEHHDTSGVGDVGVWFMGPRLVLREGFKSKPIIWRLECLQYIVDQLVTTENPSGTISNSDLEMSGGLLHLEDLDQTFDIQE